MINPSNINQGVAQNQERQSKEQTESKNEVSRAEAGDARTPDKTIGQVKYADGQKKDEGRYGKPESSPLEPEKHRRTMMALDQSKRALPDDHDSNDISQKLASKKHGVNPEQSQKEGPAAYAPNEDEPTAGDEAQKRRDKMQRQEKAEGDRR
jgi:hypothetical protein